MTGTPTTPLPYRARPAQVLLGVGAVLLVGAGAATASSHGGLLVHALLVVLAGAATWSSLRADRNGLRSSREVLAACGAALAVAGVSVGGPALDGDPVTALLLAVVFLVLHRAAPTTAAWPLASWAAFQLAVLRAIDLVPHGLHTELYLCVALVGPSDGDQRGRDCGEQQEPRQVLPPLPGDQLEHAQAGHHDAGRARDRQEQAAAPAVQVGGSETGEEHTGVPGERHRQRADRGERPGDGRAGDDARDDRHDPRRPQQGVQRLA